MIFISENGITREMTAEEIAAFEAEAIPTAVTDDARLDEIEAALMELAALVERASFSNSTELSDCGGNSGVREADAALVGGGGNG